MTMMNNDDGWDFEVRVSKYFFFLPQKKKYFDPTFDHPIQMANGMQVESNLHFKSSCRIVILNLKLLILCASNSTFSKLVFPWGQFEKITSYLLCTYMLWNFPFCLLLLYHLPRKLRMSFIITILREIRKPYFGWEKRIICCKNCRFDTLIGYNIRMKKRYYLHIKYLFSNFYFQHNYK